MGKIDNKAALKALMAKKRVVDVGDFKIEVSIPKKEDRVEIMAAYSDGITDAGDVKGLGMKKMMENTLNATVIAVRSCCGLDTDEEAYTLLAHAGGERSELGKAVQELSGFNMDKAVIEQIENGGVDDPT